LDSSKKHDVLFKGLKMKIHGTNNITASLLNAYCICSRKAWLMSRNIGINYDESNLVIGKYIDETSYLRQKKSILIENMRIDLLKKLDGISIICEIKKSSISEKAAIIQIVYYLYRFREYGISVKGELLIPWERKSKSIKLDNKFIKELKESVQDLNSVINRSSPPEFKINRYCRRCAYHDFCFI